MFKRKSKVGEEMEEFNAESDFGSSPKSEVEIKSAKKGFNLKKDKGMLKEGKKGNSKKKKIIIFIVLAALLVLFVAAKVITSLAPQPVMVTTGIVEETNIEKDITIKGTIQGSESADVASALNYKVTEILVSEGDRVTKGQTLAILDGGELADNYRKAQVSFAESKRLYEDAKALYDEGAMSKNDYLKAKSSYETDSINVASFDGLDNTRVKSPIDGTVTRVNVTLGRYASDTENKSPMFVVENLDDLQMKVKISEYDISNVKEGQPVTITAEILGEETITGVVSKISPTGEKKDESTAEMVIPVIIDVDKGDSNLIAGVTAKARILIEKRENVLTAPIDAILQDPETGENSVFVVSEGLLKKISVEVGLESNINCEIISKDIKKGDEVVLSPSLEYKDEMPVSIMPTINE